MSASSEFNILNQVFDLIQSKNIISNENQKLKRVNSQYKKYVRKLVKTVEIYQQMIEKKNKQIENYKLKVYKNTFESVSESYHPYICPASTPLEESDSDNDMDIA
jgi:predicted metalloprotease